MEALNAFWPELAGNTVGVLLGGIGALALARWQMQRQSASDRWRSREHLMALLDWARLEVEENLDLIAELQRVFVRNSSGRADLLRWAGTIGEALGVEAQAELIRAGHHRKVDVAVEGHLLHGYQATGALRNALRQAEPAVSFYVGCCGEEEVAQGLVADLHERIEASFSHVTNARRAIERAMSEESEGHGGLVHAASAPYTVGHRT